MQFLVRFKALGEPKIDHFEGLRIRGGEHKIFRFEVHMHYVLSMEVIHCKEHLPHIFFGLIFRHFFLPYYPIKKVPAS